jgi:DNA-binding NtrC family response regulator
MNILLTFTGFHDPYSVGLIGQDEQPGPIISVARAQKFDLIYLLATPNTEKQTSATLEALAKDCRQTKVEVIKLNLDDPTDYTSILHNLRQVIAEVIKKRQEASYFISVSSGTTQMHACWLLLAASGEIPAHILNIRPPRFVTRDRPMIAQANLTSPEFPIVRSVFNRLDVPDTPALSIEEAINQLGIVGDHPEFKRALETAAMLASSDAPVLILGETGTGKDLIARFVHRLSGKPQDRYVPLNCAAIPKELAESVLFGHKKGAFTGATADQEGKFDQANGGTLFLDELGELPTATQTKLLRVLQDGMIEPLGAKKAYKVNVRIIAATNQNISRAIKQGKFREDLYYRLNVGEIKLPPLRERKSDVPKIALHVLDRINASLRRPKRLSPSALKRLQQQNWPGNIRDLANAIERSLRLSRNDVLQADDLLISDSVTNDDPLSSLPEPQPGFSLEEFLGSARRQIILRAIEMANGNQSEAARRLGITPQAVHKFMRSGER